MESALKQRLIGAAVLVALAVIFLPMLIQGPAPESGVSDVPLDMPNAPEAAFETRELPLVTPAPAPADGVVGLQAGAGDKLPTVDTATAQAGNEGAGSEFAAELDAPAGDEATSEFAAQLDEPAAGPGEPADEVADEAPAAEEPTQTAAAAELPPTTAGGDYAVSFGSFSGADSADAIVSQLRGAQLPGYRQRASVDGKVVHRVRIGPYATRAQAETARLRAVQVRDGIRAQVVTLDAAVDDTDEAADTAAAEPATPAPQPTPAAAPDTGFVVQLGAFRDDKDALALRDRARAAGYTAFSQPVRSEQGMLTRVMVGPVLDRVQAEQLKAQIAAEFGIDGLVRSHP